MFSLFLRFLADQEGASLVEYGLLSAVLACLALNLLGSQPVLALGFKPLLQQLNALEGKPLPPTSGACS